MLSYRPDKATVAWFFVLLISIDVFVAFLRMCPPSEPQQAAECAEKYYGLTQTFTYWVFGWFVFLIKHNEGLVTAAATVAIAWFTLTLKKSTDNLFIATKKTAEAAEKSANGLMDAERPHMIISDIKISGIKNPVDDYGQVKLSIAVRTMNYGRSPALLKSFVNMVSIGSELDPIPQYGDPSPIRFIIAPNHWYGTIKPIEIFIPGASVAKIISGEDRVWNCIVLEYQDSFKRPHTMRSAYRVMFGAGDVSEHFYPDGPDSYWEYT